MFSTQICPSLHHTLAISSELASGISTHACRPVWRYFASLTPRAASWRTAGGCPQALDQAVEKTYRQNRRSSPQSVLLRILGLTGAQLRFHSARTKKVTRCDVDGDDATIRSNAPSVHELTAFVVKGDQSLQVRVLDLVS